MHSNLKYYITSCLFCALALTAAAQTPVIKSIDPVKGYSGEVINVKGSDFEAGAKVFFGAAEGTVISSSDQLIEVKVPAGASFDNISVLNPSSNSIGYAKQRFFLSYGGDNGISSTDFDAQSDIAAESGLYDICICDLDGDSMNDIAAANTKSNTATLLRNLSSPGSISMSKTPLTFGASTLNVTCGDLSGNGKPDIVFSEGDDGDRLFVLANNSSVGSFSFSLQTITISGASTKRIAINDLDLDGNPDLVVTDQSQNSVYLVRNTSSGSTLNFDTNITELSVSGASSTAGLEVQDLNNDGKPEIIVNQFLTDGGGFYIATNQSTSGSFSFSGFKQFDNTGTFVNLKVADIDNDGKPDIAATLFLSSSVAIFKNKTNTGETPDFSSPETLNTDQRPWGLDFSDLDGDGKKDLVVSTIGSALSVNVLHNNSSGTLNFTKVDVPVTYINRNIKSADIDGDSKPDIVFSSVDDEANSITASQISILRNNQCVTPIIEPEGPISVCAGNPLELTTQEVTDATYEWRKDGTVEKTGSDNFLDVTASGDYTVTVISENGACIELSEIITIEVKAASALPSPNILSPAGPVCIGGDLILTSENVGATKYEWSGPGGFSDTGISVTLNDFRFENSGKYYLDVYSGDCIIETKSIVVEAITSPEFFASQSGSGTYCDGDAVTLTVGPDDPDFTFQWFNQSGAITGATGTTFSPTTSGNYYAEATDLINVTCPQIATSTIEVNFVSTPSASIDAPSSTCANTTITFNDNSTVDGSANATYFWDFGDGQTSSNQNPNHAFNSEGTYTVELTVGYDGLSCSDQTTTSIDVIGNLDIEITAPFDEFCDGEMLELSATEGFATYSWSNGESTSSITVNEGGTYSVNVTDVNGCTGSDDITVTKLEKPIVEVAESDNNIAPGESVTLTASGLTNYTWSPDSALSANTGAEVIATLFETAIIEVTGQGSNGCEGSASIEIRVLQEEIGSVLNPKKYFSPNGDSKNQLWEVEKIDQFPFCGIEIYDQVGNKLYESKPYENNWDGTVKGKDAPEGVYYFIIKCDDVGVVKSGSITLLR